MVAADERHPKNSLVLHNSKHSSELALCTLPPIPSHPGTQHPILPPPIASLGPVDTRNARWSHGMTVCCARAAPLHFACTQSSRTRWWMWVETHTRSTMHQADAKPARNPVTHHLQSCGTRVVRAWALNCTQEVTSHCTRRTLIERRGRPQ